MKVAISVVFTACVIALGFAVAYADAPDSLWMRAYGDSAYQACRCIIETSDGGYAFTGYTVVAGGAMEHADVYVVRLDADGDTLWTNHYGGLGDDMGYGIRQTSDGGFIVAGSYGYADYPNNTDVYLVKLDSLGGKQWEKLYGGAGFEEAYDVQVLVGDGGFLLAGRITPPGPVNTDVYLLRTDSAGNTLFTHQYDYTINDKGYSICETTDGYVVCGNVQGSQSYDVLLLKTNSHLDSVWTRTYGGPGSDVGNSIKVTPDLGFIVAADRGFPDLGVSNGWALRVDSRGDTLWTVTMRDSVTNRFLSVDVTGDYGYVFAGMISSGPLVSRDFYAVKLAQGGVVEWETTYGTSGWEDVAVSIEEIEGGEYIIGGRTGLSGSGHMDALVVKTGDVSGVAADPLGDGREFALGAFPNPSAGSAVVAFDLAVKSEARVSIYDVAGRLVADLFRGELSAGRHCFEWNGRDLAGVSLSPGVYFCSLRIGGTEATRKLVLAR